MFTLLCFELYYKYSDNGLDLYDVCGIYLNTQLYAVDDATGCEAVIYMVRI